MEASQPKPTLRSRILQVRRGLDQAERAHFAKALCDRVLGLVAAERYRAVGCYLSVGSEPPTRDLVGALHAASVRVLLPVLLPDNDLDWAEYTGPDSVAPAGRGLLEPVGARLGVRAVAEVGLLLVPAVAVDLAGNRLGRGGGSYDRALARRVPGQRVLAVLWPGELVPELPSDPHDQRVDGVVSSDGVTLL